MDVTIHNPLPHWARWLSVDDNGAVWVFNDRPIKMLACWDHPIGKDVRGDRIGTVKGEFDWTQALFQIDHLLDGDTNG